MITKFVYLNVVLSLVLVFVGAKMLATDVYKLQVAASLGAIALLLGGSIVASLMKPVRLDARGEAAP